MLQRLAFIAGALSLPLAQPDYFYPPSLKTTNHLSHPSNLLEITPEQLFTRAKTALVDTYKIPPEQMQSVANVTLTEITHFYFARAINAITVVNQNAQVHITENGEISSTASSFNLKTTGSKINEPVVTVPLHVAVKTAELAFGAKRDDYTPSLNYLQVRNGDLVYAHQFQVRDDEKGIWKSVSVDAASGLIVDVVDYVSRAQYKVIELPGNSPDDGFTIVKDPEDFLASPKGWNFAGGKGNNARVFNQMGDYVQSFFHTKAKSTANRSWFKPVTEKTTKFNVFDSEWSSDLQPKENKDASSIQIFYLVNKLHDIFYRYGFTEAAGNFQHDNFGRGGKGNDAVIVNNQSPWGKNNANFMTPSDGQSPVMNMFLFVYTAVNRDGSLDSTIPIHEYIHGVSSRLTGGPINPRCLLKKESTAMGEGWGDAIAIYLTRNSTSTAKDHALIGSYVKPGGMRALPYSTDSVNREKGGFSYARVSDLFGDTKKPETHAMGSNWAMALIQMYWKLVDKHGFNPDWLDSTSRNGNIVALQLVLAGMAVQPCNPTMIEGRDAILEADNIYYRGQHVCLIWSAFVDLGFGDKAVSEVYANDYSMPKICINK